MEINKYRNKYVKYITGFVYCTMGLICNETLKAMGLVQNATQNIMGLV